MPKTTIQKGLIVCEREKKLFTVLYTVLIKNMVNYKQMREHKKLKNIKKILNYGHKKSQFQFGL